MPKKPKPTPVRAPDATTFTWSLSKRLKAALILLAEQDRRPASNYLTNHLEKEFEALLEKHKIELTDELIEEVLNNSAVRSFRGIPYSKGT